MYTKLNITETHLKALALFTSGFDKSFHIREVARLLRISPRWAQLVLRDLQKRGVLSDMRKGSLLEYSLQKMGSARKDYLVLAEDYKRVAFSEKHPAISQVSAEIPATDAIILVFGSFANGRERPGSDLDLLIIGEADEGKIAENCSRWGIKGHVQRIPMETFSENLRTDSLVGEVLESHVVLRGAEKLVSIVLG